MRLIRRLLAIGAAASAFLLWPATAQAHPLGNFTVNVYDGLVLSPGRIRVVRVVDLAEIPTFQQLRRIDPSGEPTAAELAAWAGRQARSAIRDLSVTVGSRPVALTVERATARMRPGQGGLPTLRLEATYAGAVPSSGVLRFLDRTFPGRIGWREVTAEGSGRTEVANASVPTVSASDALRAYPEDLLSSPPRVMSATMTFGPGVAGASRGSHGADEQPVVGRAEASRGFAGLAARGSLTPPVVALSILLALGFGALHAVGPGHGKTITAAYLVGSGGGFRQAIGVAGAVAAMHTASVLALGLLALSADRVFPAERAYPWLGVVTGSLAIVLGAMLLVRRRSGRSSSHRHDHAVTERPLSRRGLAVLAASGGLLPSPTALVVLLGSIALGRVAFGLALVGAFSLGLATALALVGVLAVRARAHLAPRLGRWARLLPVGSASAIAAAGAVVVVRAAAQL
jgi:ABC-type nickel/cobalt efflux system permease component RcnA